MLNFNENEFKNTLKELEENFNYSKREFPSFSFGDSKKCKELISYATTQTDKTIVNFEFLPEYEEIVNWMVNTNGKGLLLSGDVGRGKTNIVMQVLPLIFNFCFHKVVNTVHANEIGAEISRLKLKKFISVDDLGTESISNDYGVKSESFNTLIDAAEASGKILFISTNMNATEVLERYGVRTLDRIRRLCYVVRFEGDSYRR